MGNRAECPVCKAYTSSVYHALIHDYGECPYCKAPYEILKQWNDLKHELEELQTKRIDKDLIQQIQDVQAENCILKTKLSRLEKLFDYDGDIVKPFIEAINILYDKEEKDDDPHGYNFPKHRQF